MNILIGITGGIAAYRALDVISGLRSIGHDVRVMVTPAALNFVTEQSLSTISDSLVYKDLIEVDGIVRHIELANWVEYLIMVPATANTIAKLANGIADNLLTAVALATPPTILRSVFPAMNTNMWDHPATRRNLLRLEEYGWIVCPPVKGRLACGAEGMGKLPKPRFIVGKIQEHINLWESR